jgi:putative membrane protein
MANTLQTSERFLAWVRTGITVIAFGVVIEKFNLLVLTTAVAISGEAARRVQLERLSGPLGRYDGLALIFFGLILIGIQTVRFVRTTRMIDDVKPYSISNVRAKLIFSAMLVLLVGGFGAYLTLG